MPYFRKRMQKAVEIVVATAVVGTGGSISADVEMKDASETEKEVPTVSLRRSTRNVRPASNTP